MRRISFQPEFAAWQPQARAALRQELRPEEIQWEELGTDEPALDIFPEEEPLAEKLPPIKVPREFLAMSRRVACHREGRRWALLYRILWRLMHGEPKLLEVAVDLDTNDLLRMDKAVRHDVHKMRAFVRFREVAAEPPAYVAWFEPQHHIVELNAPFFADRFANMRWSILTPDRCAHWDRERLTFTPGVPRSAAPRDDEMEELWRTYYGSIFNPARVKVHAMTAEMPKHYWKNLPEAGLIPNLVREAPARVDEMIRKSKAKAVPVADDEHFLAQPPETDDLGEVREAATGCKACPLWKTGTQTVFGEGPRRARVMMVGEQPGDQEDLQGHPFVGPAGKLLDRALDEAGIDRSIVYVTNVVKHFKWEPRGKRRIHKKPSARDIASCRPWLEAELRLLKPKILVCLGSTAAQALLGAGFRVTKERGKIVESSYSGKTLATVHPSSLLRAPDEETRQREYALFVEDLRVIAGLISAA